MILQWSLYKMDASPPVRSVYMVIEALNIPDVKYVDVDLLADAQLKDFVKLNPQHTVPLLIDDDFTIWDSHAIAVYLVNKCGKDSPLYPNDIKKRALIDNKLHFDSGILYPTSRVLDLNPQHTVPLLIDDDFTIWDRYPNLTAWLKRCSELEIYKKGNVKGLLEYRELLKEYKARDKKIS